MGFEEVAEVAHKLRARPGARPGLLGLGVSFGVNGGGEGGGGGGLLSAADAAALSPETYQALARGFATHDDARGSVAYARLPQALSAAGLAVAPHALELLLGASLDQARSPHPLTRPHPLTPSPPHTLTPSHPHTLTSSHPHPLTPSPPHPNQAGGRLELRGFMQLATTLLALQPAPRQHTDLGEPAVVTVQELAA